MPKRRKSDGKAKERRWKSVETERKAGKTGRERGCLSGRVTVASLSECSHQVFHFYCLLCGALSTLYAQEEIYSIDWKAFFKQLTFF